MTRSPSEAATASDPDRSRPLAVPPDDERAATASPDSPAVAHPGSLALLHRLNREYRFPEDVRIGIFSNFDEQGFRLTRPSAGGDPGLTVWFCGYMMFTWFMDTRRDHDQILLYRIASESDSPSLRGLGGPLLSEAERSLIRLTPQEAPHAAALIAGWMGGRRAGCPDRPRASSDRPRSLAEVLGGGRSAPSCV